MNNKIFIGGFGGVGSRLLSQIFEKIGLYVGKDKSNDFYDFYGNRFADLFLANYHRDKSFKKIFNLIDPVLTTKPNFAIKHGQFMYMFDELKAHYPNSKNIYIMRNPVDAALKKQYIPHIQYGGHVHDVFDKKVQFYIDESIKAIEKADLTIKFEDLCFNLENELVKIKQFLGNPNLVSPNIEIKVPKSIGSGKDYYSKFNMEKLGY